MYCPTMPATWDNLPAEMKLTVVEHLEVSDTTRFSKTNREAYELCIPSLYREVNLRSSKTLRSFLDSVPAAYCRYVRRICVDLSMDGLYSPSRATTALSELLSRCSRVEDLALHIPGSLRPSIIAHFAHLDDLRKLSISNCGRDEHSPLSERLVVAIAASVPHLTHLVLDRICRSAQHAPELVGAYPFVPVLIDDDDVPAHPILGTALSLPSLLLIPSLRELRLRDTHLGDARWSSTSARCALETLELGSCCHEPPEFNAACVERIVAAAGHTVRDLTVGAALQHACNLPRLSTLRLSPLVPLENLVETLACVSSSPVSALTIECHEDDLAEAYVALEELHSLCAEHTNGSFAQLTSVSLRTVADLFEPSPRPTPKFEFAVPTPAKGAAADAIACLQRCLEDTPDTGVWNELCQSESCAFAIASPSFEDVVRADMISEEMEWL